MAEPFQVLVFGDQAVEYESGLLKLLKKKTNPALTSLFDEACRLFKAEISRLPPSEQSRFPQFSTLTELLVNCRSPTRANCAISSAAVCLHQLASFIDHFTDTTISYPTSSTACALGSCIGLLAASAVSCSRDILELLTLAPEIIAIAFRLGKIVSDRTQSVSGALNEDSYCSYIVGGITKASICELVEQHSHDEGLSSVARLYISAVGTGSVTVSGPPNAVKRFISANSKFKSAGVPVNALFHAPHLYSPADVEQVLRYCSKSIWRKTPLIPILSNEHGTPIAADCLETLLQIAISDILLKQLHWDRILDGISTLASDRTACNYNILPFASGSIQSVAAAIQRNESAFVTIVDTTDKDAHETDAHEKRAKRSKIAIIGFSGRFPDADDNEALWQLLLAGLDVHKEIPKDRFDPSLYYDPSGKRKNTSGVMEGCFIRSPGLFDSRFFNMSPREAEQADPAQRLALMTAYEAIEMAGLVPDATPSTQRNRVGVFYGTTSDDWREVNSGQNVDTYFIPGGNRAFIPGRINYHFRFSGPSYSVDTACSSSLSAVHLACNALWRGDCDTVIAGGTNVMTNPDNFAGLDRGHFLSRTGNCNTFDDGADGYCRAECVGTVILKRLEDAEADGDPIFGVILGAYTNHSAESVSITRPHSGAQEAIFKRILNSAGVENSEVSYIEMHGTGTQHGDAVEMKSVLSVFAPEQAVSRGQSLHLGSAKSNIGHAESSSGVASLIKVLLMMEKNTIPAHPGIKTRINRNFPTDLAKRNVHIAMESTPWTRPIGQSSARKAFVNNFSAAGGNSSVLLEDAPIEQPKDLDPRPLHPVAVSARTMGALRKNLTALSRYLEENPDISLSSLSYTTTARRIHHNFRAVTVGDSIGMVKEGLVKIAGRDKFLASPASAPPVGFCFTGQGSQYLGMGRQLLLIPQFLSTIQQFEEIIKRQGFEPILPFIDGKCTEDAATLPPATVQLAITCLQMALAKLWKSFGIVPQVAIGHSLGEYAAMNAAGILSDADTIFLVGTRAQLLEKHCTIGTHAMLAVKASLLSLAPFLQPNPSLEVACINAPEETVISGPNDEIAKLADVLTTRSIKVTQLKVQFAFHSSQVEPMLHAFEQASRSIIFKDPSIPLISPSLGKAIDNAKELGSPSTYLSRHCRETVNFLGALQAANANATLPEKTMWVEVGPHPICSGMLAATLGSQIKTFASIRRKEDSWRTVTATVAALYEAGLPINWHEYHHGFKQSLKVLKLPPYQWELKNHWIPYKHDWCLTKGDPPVENLSKSAAVAPKPLIRLSASVQQIVEEHSSDHEASITAQSDLVDPDFKKLLEGHKVNGIALCTSSAYADMALTLFDYLLKRSPLINKEELGIEVQHMIVDKPLIFQNQGSQLVSMTASADWSAKTATFVLRSITTDGKVLSEHAKCSGSFRKKKEWFEEWKRVSFFVNARIQQLHEALHDDSESVHMIKSGMFYKLFSALVEYNEGFRGYRELIMRSADHEATGKVRFNTPAGDGDKWFCSPYWIDSLGQITGFTMNANDAVDSKSEVFINHGWENMRIGEPLSPEKTYQTYVHMQRGDNNSYSGDVYICDSGRIVAVFQGVTFSGLARKVLDIVLPNPAAAKPAPPQANRINAVPKADKPMALLLAPRSQVPRQSSGGEKVKEIIAKEVGMAISEIREDEELENLGVDSLLALTMAEKIREELGISIDSTVFLDGITVRRLCEIIGGQPGAVTPALSDSAGGITPRDGTLTPSDMPSTPFNEPHTNTDQQLDMLMTILAEEIGVDSGDLQDDAELSSLGLDSLMSLTVMSRLKEAHIDVGSDFLLANDTVGAIRSSLSARTTMPPTPMISITQPAAIGTPSELQLTMHNLPPATSVLLQGAPKTASKTLWLFPDGSGLATSYLALPQIGPDVAVYGLNSPFIKKAEEMKCTFQELTSVYLDEVRRRQPHGPYNVGGWSAGGICAYDAAKALMAAGERVDRLLLLDSPDPIGLSKLPHRLYKVFDELNVFGEAGKRPPAWLLPHFLAFIDVLDTHRPVPFAAGRAPKTCIIWARKGVSQGGIKVDILPEDPREVSWLLNERKELGPGGWGQLVGSDRIQIEVLDDANHFSMMKGAAARQLSEFIGRALR